MSEEFEFPKTSDPWREVSHDGERFMVRWTKEAVWANRIRDRAIWLWLPKEAPEWTKVFA